MSQQKTSLGLIFLLYAGGLGAAGQFAKIATIFPEIQALYPASVVTQGLIMSVIGFLGVVFGIFVGQIVSSLGYRKMLIAGMLLGAAMSFVQAFLPPLPLFLASRMIEGLAHLAIVVAAPTLVTQVTAPNKRYLSMTLWSSFFGVGYALCASLAPFALEMAGPPALFAGHGIYMLVLLPELVLVDELDILSSGFHVFHVLLFGGIPYFAVASPVRPKHNLVTMYTAETFDPLMHRHLHRHALQEVNWTPSYRVNPVPLIIPHDPVEVGSTALRDGVAVRLQPIRESRSPARHHRGTCCFDSGDEAAVAVVGGEPPPAPDPTTASSPPGATHALPILLP